MKTIKKHYAYIIEGIYLALVYVFAQLPLRDFDIWFHLKSGELFVTQGHLQFTEIFSFAAQGRTWYPYEWLFQVIVYLLSTIGLWILPLFIVIFVVLTQFILLRIFSYIFNLNIWQRIILAFALLSATYDFNTVRPHVIAYTFVILLIFLILARIFKNRKWILFSPIATLIWTNLHSSSFIAWALPLSFIIVLLCQWFFTREKNLLKICKDFGIVSVLSLFATLTPPLWTSDYILLWEFLKDHTFLSQFIAEWNPLEADPTTFNIYTISLAIALIFLAIVIIKPFKIKAILKNLPSYFWTAPLIGLSLTAYSAIRNLIMGYMGLLVIFAFSIFILKEKLSKKLFLIIFIPFFGILAGLSIYFFVQSSAGYQSQRLFYPVQSTQFAKQYLKGRMFNDYSYGGYILYSTYPQFQVFIDGRADVYLCCEMHDYQLLSLAKFEDDKKYDQLVNSIFDRYKIDFTILPVTKNDVFRKVTRLLSANPKWSLVFWDDDSQIFVKKNGVNDQVITQFGAKYATPYLRDPYVTGHRDEALVEYQRMDQVAKTARTSNAIGFIELQKGQYDEAKKRFIEAIGKDPTFESPYMNLAELAAKDGDLDTAISLYYKAQNLAVDRGLTYIRLGQLILQRDGDTQKAKQIWEQGLRLTIDQDAKITLKKILSTLN